VTSNSETGGWRLRDSALPCAKVLSVAGFLHIPHTGAGSTHCCTSPVTHGSLRYTLLHIPLHPREQEVHTVTPPPTHGSRKNTLLHPLPPTGAGGTHRYTPLPPTGAGGHTVTPLPTHGSRKRD